MSLPIITIEDELAAFEAQERARLGLPAADAPTAHWFDAVPQTFTPDQRAHTTLLHCGLTVAHDLFIVRALRAVGYNMINLDPPDTESLRFGREFGNRGQCNPTYFTVGNLIKYLCGLRDRGMTSREVAEKYIFVTAGACGPCRFGTYVTEYRKALRDAGFEGRMPFIGRSLFKPPHKYGSTSADMIALAGALRNPIARVRQWATR